MKVAIVPPLKYMLTKPSPAKNFLPYRYGLEKPYANMAVISVEPMVTIIVLEPVIHSALIISASPRTNFQLASVNFSGRKKE